MNSQEQLNGIAGKDKFGFLQGISGNWENHRPMLLLGLEFTIGRVIELGAGEGSTSYLRSFCDRFGRPFNSYDNDKEWAERCGAMWIPNWDYGVLWEPCSLLFVDHAPGEHRKVAIARMADKADIIVIHDTEEEGAGDYGFNTIWHLFKYRLNYNRLGGGAGATAVSNKIDLNQFRGLKLGEFTFDAD